MINCPVVAPKDAPRRLRAPGWGVHSPTMIVAGATAIALARLLSLGQLARFRQVGVAADLVPGGAAGRATV